MCVCVYRPAVDVVHKGVDDVSEHKGPGSTQAILNLTQQQVHKQVIYHEDAVPLVGIGGLGCALTNRGQNLLYGHLAQRIRHVFNTVSGLDEYKIDARIFYVQVLYTVQSPLE